MEQYALNIFTSIIIAAISALITVRLSLRRFRTEKWWERKVDVYSKIIEALHNSKIFNERQMKAEEQGVKIIGDEEKELRKLAKLAVDEITKVTDVGAFFLSVEALKRLKQYDKEEAIAAQTDSWWDYLSNDLEVTNNCLKDMIEIAKKDLKISN